MSEESSLVHVIGTSIGYIGSVPQQGLPFVDKKMDYITVNAMAICCRSS